MKITQVSYGFTKNLGNFQSARVDVTVECTEDFDDADKALELAVGFVDEALGAPVTPEREHLLDMYRKYVMNVRAEGIERLR